MLRRADVQRVVHNRRRRLDPLAQFILRRRLRVGSEGTFDDGHGAVGGGGVDLAVGGGDGGGEVFAGGGEALGFVERLAGVGVEAGGEAAAADDQDVAVEIERGGDDGGVLLVTPEDVGVGEVAAFITPRQSGGEEAGAGL